MRGKSFDIWLFHQKKNSEILRNNSVGITAVSLPHSNQLMVPLKKKQRKKSKHQPIETSCTTSQILLVLNLIYKLQLGNF